MFKENSSTMISKENTSIKDSQSDNRSSNTETMTTKELHINKNTSKTHVQSSDIYSLDNVLKNNTIELEDLMKSLDKLDSVLAQIESVKKTRIELLYQTKKLQQNIKLNEEEPVSVEERAKRQQSTSLLKKRENVIKGLENMEILLSQTLLVTINNWAETLESKLKYHEKEKSLSPEIVELYEKDTSKTGV